LVVAFAGDRCLERLDDISKICESYAEPQRTDMVKALCAGTAYYLIQVILNKQPTNRFVSTVAGLLYTIVGSPEKNADVPDLRRACAQAIKEGKEERKGYWEEMRHTVVLAQLEAKKSFEM